MGFASDTFGYGVCSGGHDDDKWICTYDGGETWSERTFPDGFHANGIGFLNEDVGWIGGYPAETLQTVDGGDSWQPIQIDLVYGDVINRFVKVSEDVVYAVGNRVYKYAPEDEHFATEQCNEPRFKNADCSIDPSNIAVIMDLVFCMLIRFVPEEARPPIQPVLTKNTSTLYFSIFSFNN